MWFIAALTLILQSTTWVSVNQSTNGFLVPGDTYGAFRGDVFLYGPGGRTHKFEHSYDLGWRTSELDGECTLLDVSIDLTVEYYLPRWSSYEAAIQEDRAMYDAFLDERETFLDGYTAIVVENLDSAANDIMALGSIRCEQLRDRIGSIITPYRREITLEMDAHAANERQMLKL